MTHPRRPTPTTGPVRALRAAGLVALVAVASGGAACASLQRTVDSYSVAPSGLATPDDRLRRALATGRWDSAMVRASKQDHGAPGDALLRGLYSGLVAYYSGDWARSAGAFDRVYAITDDRLTRRVSREAASLVTNDRALPWAPSPAERLLARHYAMLAFVRAGDTAGATVEARRLVLMLQELDDAGTPVERRLRALLHYAAGAVFEAAGERNDADVAWRNAAAHGLAAPARREDDDSATVLVLVEHGWIAHKVEQSLTLGFGTREEIAWFADEDGRRAHEAVLRRERRKKAEQEEAEGEAPEGGKRDGGTWSAPGTGGATGLPGTRVGGTRAPDRAPEPGRSARPTMQPQPQPQPAPADATAAGAAAGNAGARREGVVTVATNASSVDRLFGLVLEQEQEERYVDRWDRPLLVRTTTSPGYVLTLAWPAFARPAGGPGPRAVRAYHGDSLVASDMPLHVASLSDAVVEDFRRQRKAIFARAVARAATKYWLAEKAEDRKWWAGMLVNAAGDLLERADTRSWHLLPDEVSLVRLRVPAGTHTLTADVADGRGAGPATLELGTVTLAPGETRVVAGRVWGARASRGAVAATAAGASGASRSAGPDSASSSPPASARPATKP